MSNSLLFWASQACGMLYKYFPLPLRAADHFYRFVFLGCICFFVFKLIFAPYGKEIEQVLLGMSLTTLREVPRSVSGLSRVVVGRISD